MCKIRGKYYLLNSFLGKVDIMTLSEMAFSTLTCFNLSISGGEDLEISGLVQGYMIVLPNTRC